MRKVRAIPILLLAAIALGVQSLLPIVSGTLTVAQPLLGLLVVLALRSGRTGGVILGAVLGAVNDMMVDAQIGLHGVSMTLIGYSLSWVGEKVIISSVNPVALLAIAASISDSAIVVLLHLFLGLSLAKTLWWWAVPGCLFTSVMAVGMELAAQKLLPADGDKL